MPDFKQDALRFSRLAVARCVCALALAVGSLVTLGERPAQAATVVTDCTNAGLQAALDGGGLIQFSCSTSPAMIVISTTLSVSQTAPVLLLTGISPWK